MNNEEHELYPMLQSFDLGLDENDLGGVPFTNKINKNKNINKNGKREEEFHYFGNKKTDSKNSEKGWKGTMFRFPLRNEEMKEYSQFCTGSAAPYNWQSAFDKLFKSYVEGNYAINRLLFLKHVETVKLFVRNDIETKPFFEIKIKNFKDAFKSPSDERHLIIEWLKSKMKAKKLELIEKMSLEEKEGNHSKKSSEQIEKDLFYECFKAVI